MLSGKGDSRPPPIVMLILTILVSAGLIGFAYLYFPSVGKPSQDYTLGHGGPFPVNWDAGFRAAEIANPSVGVAPYWRPSTYGAASNDAYISGGVLHTRQNNLASTSWNDYDNAVAQQGNFPWQTDCGHIVGSAPDWVCPRNSYGLRTLAWIGANTTLSVNATFLSRQGTGDYNIIIGVYFYFVNGPLTGTGGTFSYLEAQVRLASYKAVGGLQPVGTEDTWNPGFDFGYAKTAGSLQPGQSIFLKNYDLHAFYVSAMTKRGLPSTAPAIIVGVEPGTEGWGEALNIDFIELTITSYEPNAAVADPDLDQVVSQNDLTLVDSVMGTCPADFGRYQWRADTNSTNPCIDGNDLATVQQYIGQNLQPPAGLQTIVGLPRQTQIVKRGPVYHESV